MEGEGGDKRWRKKTDGGQGSVFRGASQEEVPVAVTKAEAVVAMGTSRAPGKKAHRPVSEAKPTLLCQRRKTRGGLIWSDIFFDLLVFYPESHDGLFESFFDASAPARRPEETIALAFYGRMAAAAGQRPESRRVGSLPSPLERQHLSRVHSLDHLWLFRLSLSREGRGLSLWKPLVFPAIRHGRTNH